MKFKKKTIILFLLLFFCFTSFFYPLINQFKRYQINKYLESKQSILTDEESTEFTNWIQSYFVTEGLLKKFSLNQLGEETSIITINNKIPFVIDTLNFNAAYDPIFDIIYIDEWLVKYSLEFGLSDDSGANQPLFSFTGSSGGENRIRRNLLSFILLHEIGHKILHSGHYQTFDAEYSKHSFDHKIEFEADSFALQKFRVLSDTLNWEQVYNSVISLIALNILPQFPSESEALSSLNVISHPSLMSRSSRLLKQISKLADVSTSIKSIASGYAHLFENYNHNIIAEVYTPPNDPLLHILPYKSQLLLVFESGKIGFIDFSKYPKAKFIQSLQKQKLLDPQIFNSLSSSEAQVKNILSNLSSWSQERLWIWEDTLFMIAPLKREYLNKKYLLMAAYKENEWNWKSLKEVHSPQPLVSPKIISLKDQKRILIYGDNEESKLTSFFSLTSEDTITQTFHTKVAYAHSSVKAEDINIHWCSPVDNLLYQYITVYSDSLIKESYLYEWTIDRDISRQLLFKLNSSQTPVPTQMEYHANNQSFIGLKQNLALDTIFLYRYDKSGNLLESNKVEGIIPGHLLKHIDQDKDWVGSLRPKEISSTLTLQNKEKLLISLADILIIDLKTLDKSGFNTFIDIETIGFEYEFAKNNLLITKMGHGASIHSID